MLKNQELFDKFERGFIASDRLSKKRAFLLFEAMWQESRALGAFSSKDPLDGIDKDIETARILNNVSKTARKTGKGA